MMNEFRKYNMKASKLSPGQVQEIRRLYDSGRYTQGALSREFGVSVIQIGRIVRGEVWLQLPVMANPLSDGEIQAAAERAMLVQERKLAESPELAREAAEFRAMLEGRAERVIPPSPLDGGDAPSEVAGEGLTALEKRAMEYGVDIDKLRSVK